jgi:uncharacterized protein
MTNSSEAVPSPCIRNCCLDEWGICAGCQRSLAEICGWSDASDPERLEILARCEERRASGERDKPVYPENGPVSFYARREKTE